MKSNTILKNVFILLIILLVIASQVNTAKRFNLQRNVKGRTSESLDDLSLEDKLDPNSKPQPVYHDYNHDFEEDHSEELVQKLRDDLTPEHVSYDFE